MQTFFGNLLFLQGIISPTFGSNSPLWSLANEFWYYTIFPLLFLGFTNFAFSSSRSIINLSLAVVLLTVLPNGLIFGFWLWLLGTGAHLVLMKFQHNTPQSRFWFSGAMFLLLSALLIGQLGVHAKVSDTLTAAFTSASIVFLGIKRKNLLRKGLEKKPILLQIKKSIHVLSESSYTLYITHFPVMLLLHTLLALNPIEQFQSIQEGLPLYLTLYVAILCISLVMYFLFERHHYKVRNQLLKLFAIQRESHNE